MALFGLDKKVLGQEAVGTLIGEQAKFKGELNTTGSVCVNGQFEGKIITDGEIIVAAGSKIIGNIIGGDVTVSGTVDGDITAKHALEITESGRVHGALVGGRIIIQEGSSYSGNVNVDTTGQAKTKPETVAQSLEQTEEIIIEETQERAQDPETVQSAIF